MKRAVKWRRNNNGKIISKDGYITIFEEDGTWCMKDDIERELLHFDIKEEALDAGATSVYFYPCWKRMGILNSFTKLLETYFGSFNDVRNFNFQNLTPI